MSDDKDCARSSTDESLRTERDTTDDALLGNAERAADGVVRTARRRADALLLDSRDREDRDRGRAWAAGVRPQEQQTIAHERAAADRTLADERLTADAVLHARREERRRRLAGFLDSERAATDDRLDGERARADQEVASRNDFLGIVSHDLKTMLAAIALGTRVLVQQAHAAADEAPLRRSAERIQRLVASMNHLVGDLLDVASIGAGRLAVAPAANDAVKLLGDALDAFRPLAADKHIRLEGDHLRAPLVGYFDEQRILQVIANLLSNAIKFSPPHTVIQLAVERACGELRFTVRDEGCGIPPEMLEAIFDRFRQVAPAPRVGLGLGLFISRHIAEAHGGRIWAESVAVAGSKFILALPDGQPRHQR